MNYIVPKYILSNLKIAENNKIFKIKYLTQGKYPITIFGIILKLEISNIVQDFNDYHIYLKDINEFKKYDSYLKSQIKDYKSLIYNDAYIITNTKPEANKDKQIYLNIKYVKKAGFLNIPIISIHNG